MPVKQNLRVAALNVRGGAPIHFSMRDSKILIIDPDPTFRRNARRFLGERGFSVEEAESGAAGVERMRLNVAEYALVDLNLRGPGGVEVVQQLMNISPSCGVICVTSDASTSQVVGAMRAGALDVFERPVDGERLVRRFEERKSHMISSSAAPPSVVAVPVNISRIPPVDLLVAESSAMRTALSRVQALVADETAVMLHGEVGVGLNSVAKYAHAVGPRRAGAFITVPANPDGSTAEEALFGSARVPSAFAQAKGGVVFIESLLSLGDAGQDRLAKLLQGLAASKVSGGAVRWPPMLLGLEGTPMEQVRAGKLRRDLAMLLERVAVKVPSLRQRPEDLPELVRRMAGAIAQHVGAPAWEVQPEVLQSLLQRAWSGNVKELMRVVKDAAVQDVESRLFLDLSVRPSAPMPVQVAPEVPAPAPVEKNPGWAPTLDEEGQVQPYDVYEAEIFKFALHNAGGCVSRAAELLGVGRATMYRKMRAYEIEVPPVSERAISRSRRKKRNAANAANRNANRPASSAASSA